MIHEVEENEKGNILEHFHIRHLYIFCNASLDVQIRMYSNIMIRCFENFQYLLIEVQGFYIRMSILMLGLVYSMQLDLDKVHSISETAITIRGSRRRITVPVEVVDQLELKDGDKLRWVMFKDLSIYLQKVQ